MSNYSKIYWLTRLDTLHGLGLTIMIFSIALIGMYYIIIKHEIEDNNDGSELVRKKKKANKFINFGYVLIVLGLIITLFLPRQKEALLIIAGGKTLDFVQSDTSINKIPAQTTAIISKFFDEQLKEVKETK